MAIHGHLQGLAFLARGKTWADPLAEDRAGESRISGGSSFAVCSLLKYPPIPDSLP